MPDMTDCQNLMYKNRQKHEANKGADETHLVNMHQRQTNSLHVKGKTSL